MPGRAGAWAAPRGLPPSPSGPGRRPVGERPGGRDAIDPGGARVSARGDPVGGRRWRRGPWRLVGLSCFGAGRGPGLRAGRSSSSDAWLRGDSGARGISSGARRGSAYGGGRADSGSWAGTLAGRSPDGGDQGGGRERGPRLRRHRRLFPGGPAGPRLRERRPAGPQRRRDRPRGRPARVRPVLRPLGGPGGPEQGARRGPEGAPGRARRARRAEGLGHGELTRRGDRRPRGRRGVHRGPPRLPRELRADRREGGQGAGREEQQQDAADRRRPALRGGAANCRGAAGRRHRKHVGGSPAHFGAGGTGQAA
mmetsp:Transcript_59437/g.184469  ORF Transcript_59437/g.184469 Transcript_59437/m.184469 type:complete len:310 (-) Transcript_59437:58-987(-)